MSLINAADRAWIENKFHKQDEPFDPLRRMAYHGHDFDVDSGQSDEEILAGLQTLSEACEGCSHPVAKARAVRYVLEHTRIAIDAHDYFPGIYSLNRLITDTTVRRWRREIFGGVLADKIQKMNELNTSCALTMGPDFDHVVPDWDAVMSLGLTGLRDRARAYRAKHEARAPLAESQSAYFDGIEEEYTALIAFTDRLYRNARSKSHAKAALVAESLRRLRDGAPQSFLDALLLLYLFALICECVDYYQMRSIGNGLDHTLRPFWERDLASGSFTRAQLREFLAYFMLQFSAIGNYWGHPFYLGGNDEAGNTRVCALSYEILDVYDQMEIYSPKIQIKYAKNTPPDFTRRALDMIRRGHSSIVFCCEPAFVRAVMSYGATLEEARTIDIRGCFETGVRANEVSAEAGCINAAGALTLALHEGIDPVSGKAVGAKTPPVAAMRCFEDVQGAFLAQLEHLVNACADIACAYEPYFAEINPSSLYSATVTHSLECATDGYCSGVKFNNSAMPLNALGSAVDALMAIRALVFEQKLVSLTDFVEVLDRNFEGAAALRAAALSCPHKYGTGDPEADDCARTIAAFYTDRVSGRPNGRGGVFKAACSSAMEFLWQGERTAATPDGRLALTELSKNASPTPGMEKNGVTALIRSATAMDQARFAECCVLDVMLHPSAAEGEEGLAAMQALLNVYMAHGGMGIQFNVFRAEQLRDAQLHPERYRNLQIRVAGWNALWNNLSKKEQDAYILRAEAAQ